MAQPIETNQAEQTSPTATNEMNKLMEEISARQSKIEARRMEIIEVSIT
jgi:hypothetical protein